MKKVISLTLISVLLFLFLTACSPAATTTTAPFEEVVSWELNCARMSQDGTVIEKIVCSFDGILQHPENEEDVLYCALTTPEPYPFSIPNIKNFATDERNRHFNGCAYFASSLYAYSKEENAPKFCHLALDVRKEYFIVRWDNTDEYLVGTVDPNVDLSEVFLYFEAFRNICDEWSN